MHLKLFVAVTDRGLFQLKHSNSQGYHGHTWYQFTQKDLNRNIRLPVEQDQFPLAVKVLTAVQPVHCRCTMMRPSTGLLSQFHTPNFQVSHKGHVSFKSHHTEESLKHEVPIRIFIVYPVQVQFSNQESFLEWPVSSVG